MTSDLLAGSAGRPSRRDIGFTICGWLLQVVAAGFIVVAMVEALGGRLFTVPAMEVWPLSMMRDVGWRDVVGAWLLGAIGASLSFCGSYLDRHGPVRADEIGLPRVIAWLIAVVGFVASVGSIAPAAMLARGVLLSPAAHGVTVAGTSLVQRVLLSALAVVVGLPSLQYAGRTWRFARRFATPVIRSPATLRGRRFVLYLRSFHDDVAGTTMPDPSGGAFGFLGVPILNPGKIGESIATHEEFIARLFGRIGRVVAVGRPGQRLPFCGAARFSLPHDAWKPVVSELIQRAELVLLVASTGPSTLWEFTEAVRLLPPQRLLLLVQHGHAEYDGFREAAAVAFAERAEQLSRTGDDAPVLPALPDYPPLKRPDKATLLPLLRGAVRFGARWEPVFDHFDPTVTGRRMGQSLVAFQMNKLAEHVTAGLGGLPARSPDIVGHSSAVP